MRPQVLETRERHAGHPGFARAVHVAVLFPGDRGMAQASAFQARLLSDVSRWFRANMFGKVYTDAVSAPYLVRVRACMRLAPDAKLMPPNACLACLPQTWRLPSAPGQTLLPRACAPPGPISVCRPTRLAAPTCPPRQTPS